MLLLVCTLLLVGLTTAHRLVLSHSPDDLFEAADRVFELRSDDLTVLSPEAAECPWIILFYDPTCGHCRNFAPIMTSFAAQRKNVLPLFGAINCVAHEKVCQERHLHDFPSVFVVNSKWDLAKGKANAVLLHSALESLTPALNGLAHDRKLACESLFSYLKTLKTSGQQEVVSRFMEEKRLHPMDIANAFFFTMWHEVTLTPKTQSSLHTLQQFLSVVQAALPDLGAGSILKQLQGSDKVFNSVNEWKTAVLAAGIPISGTVEKLEWKTCKGSQSHYRGFSCGLWLLYHSILSSVPSERANAALLVIHEYVLTFFLCKDCRMHFSSFPLDIQSGDPDGGKAILWLWRAHNSVNLRLKSEDGQDPLVVKGVWPSLGLCQQCYDSDGNPIESAALDFIQSYYYWRPGALRLDDDPADRKQRLQVIAAAFFLVVAVIAIMWISLQHQIPVKQREAYKQKEREILKGLKLL